jgi:hypothetical protein
MPPRRRSAVAAAVVAAGLAGLSCGGASDDPRSALRDATAGLGKIRSGTLHLKVQLTPHGGRGPVGIGLDGPFDLDAGTPLAVADMKVTRFLGGSTSVVRVVSTGRKAWAGEDGKLRPLTDAQAQQLKLAGGERSLSAADLDLSRWVRDPSVADGPKLGGDATTRIRGRLDASAVLRDLGRLAGARAAQTGDAAETLRDDAVEVLTGADDGLLRRLSAGARLVLPERLRALAGGAGDVRVRIEATIERPNREVTVRAPG